VEWVRGSTTSTGRIAELEASGIEAHVVRLGDREALRRFVAGSSHLLFSAAAGAPGAYRDVYVRGMRRLLETLDRAKPPHVVYTSSSGIYGRNDGGWVDEDGDPEPRGHRALALAEAEQVLSAAAAEFGLRATILRLTGIVGPERGPHRRATQLAGRRRDDGDLYLNLVHADDVVEAICRVLARGVGGLFNVTSPRPLCRREFYDQIVSRQGLPAIEWTPAGDALGKRVDGSRLERVLGFRPREIQPERL
jgi:nucleoside-diphosphate-sugar epimerase